MNLRETQALFWKAITWPTGVADFLAQADDATRQAFEATFDQTAAFGRAQRVEVYAEAYFWRLFEVALDQYGVTAWLAGKTGFHNLITDFVLACPSSTPDLRWFAAPLADFIRTHAAQRRLPGLADVAAIDWAINVAVDRADEPRLGLDALASLPAQQWPRARFALTQTASVLPCALPYSTLWTAHAQGAPVPDDLAAADPPHAVLVWRQADHDVYQRTLEPAEASAIAVLQEGGTFAALCDAAAGDTMQGAGPEVVVQWLRRWLTEDLLTAVVVD